MRNDILKKSSDTSTKQLNSIFVFVMMCGVFMVFMMIYSMFGGFKLSNKEKMEIIEECTSKNYGVIFDYNMLSLVEPTGVSCCIPGEQYCKFDYLKIKNEKK